MTEDFGQYITIKGRWKKRGKNVYERLVDERDEFFMKHRCYIHNYGEHDNNSENYYIQCIRHHEPWNMGIQSFHDAIEFDRKMSRYSGGELVALNIVAYLDIDIIPDTVYFVRHISNGTEKYCMSTEFPTTVLINRNERQNIKRDTPLRLLWRYFDQRWMYNYGKTFPNNDKMQFKCYCAHVELSGLHALRYCACSIHPNIELTISSADKIYKIKPVIMNIGGHVSFNHVFTINGKEKTISNIMSEINKIVGGNLHYSVLYVMENIYIMRENIELLAGLEIVSPEILFLNRFEFIQEEEGKPLEQYKLIEKTYLNNPSDIEKETENFGYRYLIRYGDDVDMQLHNAMPTSASNLECLNALDSLCTIIHILRDEIKVLSPKKYSETLQPLIYRYRAP